jgi:hypothetical protein|tara:strand:+ start:143 stop:835 length:693 start_codon:yes stop_codon:yes gene_type:complete
MAFKVPIHVEGEMSAFYFGTGGNMMFVSLWEWKRIKRGKKPGELTPIYQPTNQRYQFTMTSYVIATNQHSINFRKTCNLIYKNLQRQAVQKRDSSSYIPPAQKEAALENLFKATKEYVEKFNPQKIETYISEFVKNEIINKINNNVRFEDISYTQFIHRRGKRIFIQNGEIWEIMTIPEMVRPALYFLRLNNKYLSINYLPVKGIKYDSTNPLITNSILARMGNEMLNRS